MKLLSKATITPDVALRAFAITSVVFNHAAAMPDRPFELGGGLNILLMLSGYSFARFTLTHDSGEKVRRSIAQFGLNLLLPCLAIVLLCFALKRQWSWGELLFVSNFYQLEHIALLYTWYPQTILQMLLVFYLLTLVPGVVVLVARRPLLMSVGLTVASYAMMLVLSQALRDYEHFDRIVFYSVWNFALGWAVYFAAGRAREGAAPRIGLLALAVALALWSFGNESAWLRAVALIGAVAAMLFVRRLVLPAMLARVLTILSQATFTIFLLHVFFLRAFDAVGLREFPTGFHLRDVLFCWALTMAGTVGAWIVLASISRAWRFQLSDQGAASRRDEPVSSALASRPA